VREEDNEDETNSDSELLSTLSETKGLSVVVVVNETFDFEGLSGGGVEEEEVKEHVSSQ
jgi:hypothetical protein